MKNATQREPAVSDEIKLQADELKARGETPTVHAFFDGRRFTGHGIRFGAPLARSYEDGTRSEPRYTP